MFLIDSFSLVLPDVADRCNESDVASVADRVGGDVAHLLDEQVGGVELEPLGGLVAKVDVILRVRDHRQREDPVVGRRRRCGRAREQQGQ